MTGFKRGSEIDEFERKQALRANKRRPIQETIDEIGEFRGKLKLFLGMNVTNFILGIQGPGFAERRAARIKAAYGIDVPGGKP